MACIGLFLDIAAVDAEVVVVVVVIIVLFIFVVIVTAKSHRSTEIRSYCGRH